MARILRFESSLRRQQERLRRETVWLLRLRGVERSATVILLAAGLLRWGFQGRLDVLGFGIAALVLTAGHEWKRRENAREIGKLAIGAGGENALAERLAADLPDDAWILNDLEIRQGGNLAQIDHIVVSPRGIFVVETKMWKGRLAGSLADARWILKRDDGSSRSMKNPVRQNRRQANLLRAMLSSHGFDWPDIVPLVVMASPRCIPAWEEDLRNDILPTDAAIEHLRRYAPRRAYDAEEIRGILALFGTAPDAQNQ